MFQVHLNVNIKIFHWTPHGRVNARPQKILYFAKNIMGMRQKIWIKAKQLKNQHSRNLREFVLKTSIKRRAVSAIKSGKVLC